MANVAERREAIMRAGREDFGGAQINKAMTVGMKTAKGRTQAEAEPSPILLYHVPLLGHGHEVGGAGYSGQPQRKRETRMVSPGAVSSLVRRLMAMERARILGRKAIDRYPFIKRTERWRE